VSVCSCWVYAAHVSLRPGRPNCRALDEPEKTIFLIGASIHRPAQSAGRSAAASLGHCEIRAWTSLRIDRLRARDSSDLRPWLQQDYRAVTKRSMADRYWTEDGGSKKLIKVAILSLTVWGSGLANFQALQGSASRTGSCARRQDVAS